MTLTKFENLQDFIVNIRDQKVIIDVHVAQLYDVETKRINEAVKNNPDKFPPGYVIDLNPMEWSVMRSKISTSFGPGGKVKLPKAFTEKGLYMLATILKSPRATQTTLSIIETFAQIRELSRTVAQLSEAKDQSTQKSLMERGSDIISELLGDDGSTNDSETSVELNFAVFKFKHTIKRKNDKQ